MRFNRELRRVSLIGAASCLMFGICQAILTAAPEIPGDLPKKPLALVGATIHPVSAAVIEEGILVNDQGRIVALGSDVVVPPGSEQVDVRGKHLYPGLFDAHSHVGLIEVSSIRATIDNRELGDLNPSVSAQLAVNPDSEVIPVTRSNGILLALTAPTGSLISGSSAVIQLDGWTWEEMTVAPGVAMHITWPRMAPVARWPESRPAAEQSRSRDRSLRALDQAIADATAYRTARDAADSRQPHDSRWEAMIPVLAGEMPLIIAADEVQQIQAAIAWTRQHRMKMILYGGYDALQCAELLKKHDIPVIVGGVYRLPRRRSDPYDTPFTLPQRLRESGIRFCISSAEGAANVRNLPHHAAMASAFGLPAGEALKAVTLYPAEILGVADRVGSLEVGKDATLIVTDGDPLDTTTHVEAAFIAGRPVDLSDRHKRLNRKYQEKYQRQQ